MVNSRPRLVTKSDYGIRCIASLRRARYIFRHVFPRDIAVRIAGARDGDFDPQKWWEKRKSIKELTREFAGMLVAIWELRGATDEQPTSLSLVGMGELNPQLLV